MRSVKQDELLGLASYEGIRDQFRARLIDHKKRRRILLGPEVSLMFEDHDSVMLQVQEMLRTERISDPTAVRFEVETYNDLVPPDGALLATLMIEEPDQDERERKRREYVGLDRAVFMEIGAGVLPGGSHRRRLVRRSHRRGALCPIRPWHGGRGVAQGLRAAGSPCCAITRSTRTPPCYRARLARRWRTISIPPTRSQRAARVDTADPAT